MIATGARHLVKKCVDTVAESLEKLNMDLDSDIVTLEEILEAYKYLHNNHLIIKTPTLQHVQDVFDNINQDDDESLTAKLPHNVNLSLKLENMQLTGSFKIRGAANQMQHLPRDTAKLVTYSAGNYGKGFAHCVSSTTNIPATVILPDSAPSNRVSVIKSYGVDVKVVPNSELMAAVDQHVADGFHLLHSFDDVKLIAGNATAGLEIVDDIGEPDIILVCCGGGGLVSGVGAYTALSGLNKCRVYGVEPEGACTMYESLKNRRPVSMTTKSIATGLSPPSAGAITYKHCRWFVEDILLVSDYQILTAMRVLFNRGIKAEPSGCAAMAALLFNKVPDVVGKNVVVMITGGNITTSELLELLSEKKD